MSWIPALCMSCSRVLLASVTEAQGGPTCPDCGADARVVPGCSFSAAAREQFLELSDIVAQAHLTPAEADAYAAPTRRALQSGAYAQQLDRLTTRLLGLLPLHIAAGKNFNAQRGILLKLQTIFEALATATGRGGSAEYAIATKGWTSAAGPTSVLPSRAGKV